MRTYTITTLADFSTVTVTYPDEKVYIGDNQYVIVEYTLRAGARIAQLRVVIGDPATHTLIVRNPQGGRVVIPLTGIMSQLTIGNTNKINIGLYSYDSNNDPHNEMVLPASPVRNFTPYKGRTLAGRSHYADSVIVDAGFDGPMIMTQKPFVAVAGGVRTKYSGSGDYLLSLSAPTLLCAYAEANTLTMDDGTVLSGVEAYATGIVWREFYDSHLLPPGNAWGTFAEFINLNGNHEHFFILNPEYISSGDTIDIYTYDQDGEDLPLQPSDSKLVGSATGIALNWVKYGKHNLVTKSIDLVTPCVDGIESVAVSYTNTDGLKRYAVGRRVSTTTGYEGDTYNILDLLKNVPQRVVYSASRSVVLAFNDINDGQHLEDLLLADDVEVYIDEDWLPAVVNTKSLTAKGDVNDYMLEFVLQN